VPNISEKQVSAAALSHRYRFTRKLAAGEWCDVFHAIEENGRQVAIKMMQTENPGEEVESRRVARFRREMQLASRLRHPNVVQVLDAGETDSGLLYIVFEYIDGPTLGELLKKQGPLDIETAVSVAMQVLEALGTAHENGIVHRDLKPENILLSQKETGFEAKVLDFGISGLLPSQWADASRLTLTREFLGTPSCASPEQLRGEPVGTKADIYAWGITFLECLTGRSPFGGSSVAAIVQQQLSSSPVPIPPLLRDHPLGTLLRWALEKDPSRRAGNSLHLLDRLRGVSLEGIPRRNGFLPEPDSLPWTEAGDGPKTFRAQTPLLERRQISALCIALNADSVGDQSSPDVVDEIYHDLLDLCLEKAKDLGGYVAGESGDRLLVYFGFPHASDTDARRAMRAALVLSDSLLRKSVFLKAQHGFALFHQIGMHTGMVTVRSTGQARERISGITPNTAAKLCGWASPNTILISEESRALLKNIVDCEPISIPRDNAAAPVLRAHRVLGERAGEGQIGLAQEAESRMIGREFEHDLIVRTWNESKGDGKGKVVFLQGEPGMGKSRLAAECAATIQTEAQGGWLEFRFTPETRNSPLFNILEMLKNRLGLAENSGPGKNPRNLLEKNLDSLGMPKDEVMPLFCAWLNLPGEGYPLPPFSPQRAKALFLGQLAELLSRLAKAADAAILMEDLHWIDPTSRELLPLLIDEGKKRGVFLLLTARPEFEPPWGPTEAETIRLEALDGRDAEKLILEALQDAPIGKEILHAMVDRSGGVALFALELARMYREGARDRQGGRISQTGSMQIPNSLRDLLLGRLDRTGPAKETAQVAAVLGRTFSFDVLAKVSWRDEALVLSDLDQLVSEGLLHVRLRVGNPEYQFHHALVRDAAYDSLAARAKSELHLRIAQILEKEFPAMAESQAEAFAMHWAGAGEYGKAVQYGTGAAGAVLQRSLYTEAIALATDAIEWAKKMADPAAAAENELRLHQILQPALMATKGFSAPPVLQSVTRAEELSRHLAPGSELPFPVYWGLLLYYFALPDYRKFSQLLSLASAVAPDPGSVAALKAMEGHRAFSSGEFPKSIALLDEALSMYDSNHHRDHALKLGHDTRVFALSTKSLNLTLRGLFEEAENSIAKALAWADELKSSHSQAMARAYRLGIYHYRGEREKTSMLASELIEFCSKNDTPIWLFPAHLLGGWADNQLERTVQSLEFCQQMGVNQFASYWNSAAAEIEIRLGESGNALARLDKFIRQAEEIGEPFYAPELYRLRAQCHASDREEEKLKDLSTAIEYARKMGAGLIERRAKEDIALTQ